MCIPTRHPFSFDPTHGYDLPGLLAQRPPEAPPHFDAFWQQRHERARVVDPRLVQSEIASPHPQWRAFDITYSSTDSITISGWLLLPATGPVRRGIVVGHGYGGRTAPDFDFPAPDAALLFPCLRGLTRSRHADIPGTAAGHVLCGIDTPQTYVIGGCVEDVWVAVSALENLCPGLPIGYSGVSFGGGIGALALGFDRRIDRGFLTVPTFGNIPLWLTLPSVGSAASAQSYVHDHPQAAQTLSLFDAAIAATRITTPVLMAPARFDPSVAPPCQFAVNNAVPSALRETVVLDAGHFDYDGMALQQAGLRQRAGAFFAT